LELAALQHLVKEMQVEMDLIQIPALVAVVEQVALALPLVLTAQVVLAVQD
jgi:hypothetical protein